MERSVNTLELVGMFMVVLAMGLYFASLIMPDRLKLGMTPKQLAVIGRGGLLMVFIMIGFLGRISSNHVVFVTCAVVQIVGAIIIVAMFWIDWPTTKRA